MYSVFLKNKRTALHAN